MLTQTNLTMQKALAKLKADTWFHGELTISMVLQDDEIRIRRKAWTSGTLKRLLDVLEPFDLDFYIADSKTIVIQSL